MNLRYTLQDITFEWDGHKAAANFRKHDVSFELACEVFFDPFVCYLNDEVIEDELRETILGLTGNWRLLYVVYVMRDDVIRIVSARLATRTERERYENQ
ncbi:MAG: BrnT family toxin [Anaerolineae bacterium]|nr:BrnT family toxin [Anaerolineae bacterium]